MRPSRSDLIQGSIVLAAALAIFVRSPGTSSAAQATALLLLGGTVGRMTAHPSLIRARTITLAGLSSAFILVANTIPSLPLLGAALAAATWVVTLESDRLGAWAGLGLAALSDALHPGAGTVAFAGAIFLRAPDPAIVVLACLLAAAVPPWGGTLLLQSAVLILVGLGATTARTLVANRGLREGPQRVVLLFAALTPSFVLALATTGLAAIESRLPMATPTMIFTLAALAGAAGGVGLIGYALALSTTHLARPLLVAAPAVALVAAALIDSGTALFLLAPAGVALTLGIASLARLLPPRIRSVLLPRDKPL